MFVTGPSTLDVPAFSCPPAPSGVCDVPTRVHVDGGSGSIVDGYFTLAMTGSYEFCDQPYAFSFDFAGHRE